MKIGVVREIKNNENRVALTPAGVDRLHSARHEVLVEAGAGIGSGLPDEAFKKAGARLADVKTVWARCDLVLKVKEPLEKEWPRMRPGQTLFTYYHLAADRKLTEAVLRTRSYCFAYETLELADGSLPLLTPMSEVAGRMAIQAGAQYLEKPHGGSGILLGGVPGVRPARVLVLGGGVVGTQAARMAAGLGAHVTIMDVDLDRLRYLDEVLPANCNTVYSTPHAIREALPSTDLVVGAVLITGHAAPKLIARADLKHMRRGSVIVDVAVDQGGCIETVRPTTHADPVYEVDGIVHYCVANMPGAVPRTSTFALTNATLPWTLRLAQLGPERAIAESRELASAANAIGGHVTHPAVAESFGMPYVAPLEAIREGAPPAPAARARKKRAATSRA